MRIRNRMLTAVVIVLTLVGIVIMEWRSVFSFSRMIHANEYKNSPFQNELSLDIVKPIAQFDPVTANPSVYDDVTVYNAAGRKFVLNASRTPLLFEAYWCPHCQRTLVLLNKNWSDVSRKPLIISMGFKPNTSLQQAVNLEHRELKTFRLDSFDVYYLLNSDQTKYVPFSYPTLVFHQADHLEMLHAEHTLSIWLLALNGKRV